MSSADWQVRWSLVRQARRADRAALRADQTHNRAVLRRERILKRARTRLPVSSAVAVGAAAVPLAAGGWTWLWYVAAGFGLRAVRAGAVLLRPPALPERLSLGSADQPPPPPARSAAFPAVCRLEAVKRDLTRLLPMVAPIGRAAAEEARRAAAETDLALRWQAARLAAVEPHRGVPLQALRTLEQGVAAQEQLVAAVADLVAASVDPYPGARLQEATDALAGLAAGLRELG